jgi:hypothetical protein
MIDTIVINIDINRDNIIKPNMFQPSADSIFNGISRKATYIIPSIQKKNGIYHPRLTLTKYSFNTTLKVEFSAPKLLYGNNLQELEDNNFIEVSKKLLSILNNMGILLTIDEIIYANVSKIHFGKNIHLTKCTSNLIINTINKFDVSKRLDSGSTDFRNEGHAIRFHTNMYEVCFYDKVKDLQQSKISEKRSLEKDNYTQSRIFDNSEPLEILRMEVRLNNRKNIKTILSKLNYNIELTFKSLFSKELSKIVLIHFWSLYIESSKNIIILANNDPLTIINLLISNNISSSKSQKYLGALIIIKEYGIRTLKLYDKSFSRLYNDLKDIGSNNNNYLNTCFNEVKYTLNS